MQLRLRIEEKQVFTLFFSRTFMRIIRKIPDYCGLVTPEDGGTVLKQLELNKCSDGILKGEL